MNQTEHIIKVLFSLIQSEICGKEFDEKYLDDLSNKMLEQLYKISKSHDIGHLIASALNKQKLLAQDETSQKYQKQLMIAVYQYERINYELEQVSDILENHGISFLPLKGSILRKFYPEPWMRTSCDIDILVKESDADNASKILAERLQYKINEKGQHDVSLFSPSNIHFELHFKLLDSDFKQVKDLIDVWSGDEISLLSDSEYQMSNELFLLYHIYHMAKHFVRGGCGIKPFIDLWVIQNKIDYDEEKAEKFLKESDLFLFYNHAMELMNVWFEGKPHNSVTKEMENYVLQGGVYGTLEQQLAMSQNKRGGKFRHLLSKIFLSYEQMKVYYPSVKKCPILFPFYQVRRWFRILFCGGRKAAMNEIKLNQSLSEEKKQAAKRLIDELGL